jgi:hypothetical protein
MSSGLNTFVVMLLAIVSNIMYAMSYDSMFFRLTDALGCATVQNWKSNL